ncbi:MAG: glycoside hydrolase family 97 protein [Chitinophagaceae bacterium]|nr:glycoside hydrolase family 97 protein [Chitinophagaceae bacterium]
MIKKLLSFFYLVLIGVSINAQKSVSIQSPDKKIRCTIKIGKEGIKYHVAYKKETLIGFSSLLLKLKDGTSTGKLSPGRISYSDSVEKYELLTGRSVKVEDHYKQVSIPLSGKDGKSIIIVFRAFNSGVAFRYKLQNGHGSDSFAISAEVNEFNLAGSPGAKALLLPNFTSSHEGYYTSKPLSEITNDTLMDMPALFRFHSGTYMAITEAALLDYAGMYLIKKNNILQSCLSPLPSDTSIFVKGRFPHESPWRVMMISDDAGDFLENNMLTTLSPPRRISEVDWIKPGKTTFPWWNGNVVPDTINAPGNNFVTNKYFIDFCSRNKIQYHSVVEYGLHQWYMDDGVGFQPGPHSDPTTPVPGLDMKEVCDYAHSQGVGIRVWVHWWALYPKIDGAFANFEKWGISGMMIDFMDRDDQEMVNIQTEMLEKAAKHHLHVQFHGAYKPTGLSRTYPNEFTREGTLNYEVNKWGPGLTANHDLDIAFTRLIAGSTDYHLGGFRAVPDSLYRVQYTRPLMLGTRCHMLALYVVYENANAMVCDYPEAYEGQEGFDFIKEVPTVWDETVAIAAKPDEYLIIARRKGKDWFIGAINNDKDRVVNVPLSFLSAGNYNAEIYSDHNSHLSPNSLKFESKNVDRSTRLMLNLAGGGGAAIRIRAL